MRDCGKAKVESMKIFLFQFDGEQLFHNSRPLTIVKVFEYSSRVKNPYHELHKDLFIRKTYEVTTLLAGFFDDDEYAVPGLILEKIKGQKHYRVERQFISYYKKREEEFFQDMDAVWEGGECTSYAFVSDVHKLIAIMYNCGKEGIENDDKEFDIEKYENYTSGCLIKHAVHKNDKI
uniref:Uncharacterized protein n=1 Tax=Marseillevirus LCMAC101 TaxID=2506602 RepID=A0A481YQG6_9VIRU|nr:MAG: hypothetical protein LCMAC101_00380 [Marseillevirus LCMAC101]